MKKNTTMSRMEQLVHNDNMYCLFCNSTNDSVEILKNYKAAVTGCKSSLKLLKNAATDNQGRIIPEKGFRKDCGRTKKQSIKFMEYRLKFLTDENCMLKGVNNGSFNKYIYDVIKKEVFDKKQKVENNK